MNAPFRVSHTATQRPGGEIPVDLSDIPTGPFAIDLPSHTIAFDSLVNVTGGNYAVGVAGNGLTNTPDGTITHGTISLLVTSVSDKPSCILGFVDVTTAAFNAATHTQSTQDDIAIFNQALAGNDFIVLSGFADVFNAGNGKDLVVDVAGSDRITAGGGNDLVLSGGGNDRVVGALGNDVLAGMAGNDTLSGGIGDDTIWGGAGADSLTGEAGRDVFLFHAGDGSALIGDFQVGVDRIAFMGPAAALNNLQITEVDGGASTRLNFSNVVVILQNVAAEDLPGVLVTANGNPLLQAGVTGFFDGWDYV